MNTRTSRLSGGLVTLLMLATLPAFAQQQANAAETDPRCAPYASPAQKSLSVPLAPEPAAFQFQFPRDYFNHPGYSWEWWYYSGNLRGENEHDYGFELVFFRRTPNPGVHPSACGSSTYYFADFAISDLTQGRFYYYKRFRHGETDYAGVNPIRGVWNGDWYVKWPGATLQDQELKAASERSGIHLLLHPEKPPVVHDRGGMFLKDHYRDNSGHYFSFSRVAARGDLVVNDVKLSIHGLAWIDHEFFDLANGEKMPAWDWFAIQLNDGRDLMLYRLRNSDGSVSSLAAGTLVDKNGSVHHLVPGSFNAQPGATWHSPISGGQYPVEWSIVIPAESLLIHAATPLSSQELASKRGDATPTYWEGAMRYTGNSRSKAVTGLGYLEMTGYAQQQPE